MHDMSKGSRRFRECQPLYKSANYRKHMFCSLGIAVISEYWREIWLGVHTIAISWFYLTPPYPQYG